jgi:hypothetical protein
MRSLAAVLALFLWSMSPAAGAAPPPDEAAARAVFDETETLLALAPARQVEWACAYADRRGPKRTSAADLQTAVERSFPDDPPAMKIQIRLITSIIMTGDIVGALQSYSMLVNRQVQDYNLKLVQDLASVQKARSTIIRNFARSKPPRAYAGQDPSQAARVQDKSARYTQFVQVNTQLMNELQNSSRELMDSLQAMRREVDELWQAYSSFRDQDFRTNERVMRMR